MDEQTYYEHSLTGLEAIAEYSRVSSESNERTADATENIAHSVSDFIKQYQKANKKEGKKKSGDAAGIGGSISDIIEAVKQFDEPMKEKGNDMIDFFSRLHTDAISKYTGKSADGISDTVDMLVMTVERIDSMLKSASKITPSTVEVLSSSVEKILSGFDKITPESAQAFNTIVDTLLTNVLSLGQSLAKSIPYYIKAQISVPLVTSTLKQLMNVGKDSGITPEDAQAMSTIVESLANNVLVLGQSLSRSAKFYKAAEPAIPLIGRVITNLITTIYENLGGKDDLDRALVAADTIQVLSKGVFSLAKALAFSAPLMVLSIPGALAFRVVMKIISPALSQLSRVAPEIGEGSKALRHMSLSILMFSGSIVLSALALRALQMSDIPKLAALFGAMGIGALVYYQLGRYGKEIVKGSLAVLAMSGATFLFALALKTSVDAMPNLGQIGLLILGLGGLALTYGIIGSFATNILLGALAVAGIGLSLWLLSNPLKTIAGTLNESGDVLWKLPVLLTGLGVVYAAAGVPVVAGLIVLGAAAFAAIGGSLLLIAAGIKSMSEISMTTEDAMNLKFAIKGVIEGFTEGFSGLSVKEALTLPLKIAGVAAMGVSLRVLAGGIGKWKEDAGDWSKADTNQLTYTINSLSKAFAVAGSTKGQTKIFGFKVGKNDAERGIASTMKMGRNLKRLAKGIGEWKEMDLTEEEMQVISNNITRVLTTIPNIFSAIGKSQREDSSNQATVLGITFGIPFTKTDVELGIESTMKMGKNLKNLADGISAWKDMPLTPEVMQTITDNITRVLTTIPNIFAAIGKTQRENSTNQVDLLGVTFSVPFTQTDVELGIESTMEMGTNLKTLAEGVFAWKEGGEGGFKSEDLPGIQANILKVLSSIPSAFAAIGREDRELESGILWWKKGDVERGVDLFKTIGPTIKSVADLVMGFKDVPDVTKHAENIGTSVSTILMHVSSGLEHYDSAKIKILKDLPKPLNELTKIFKEWGEIFKGFMDMDFAKVEEAAVLALKFDRIQKGLAYEDIEVDVDGDIKTKSIETKPKKKDKAADKAAIAASSETDLIPKLLEVMEGMQQMIGMNTLAMQEMKDHLMGGIIKTKEMSNNEF